MVIPLERHVEDVLRRLDLLDGELVIALSGGVDSMVLLDIVSALSERHPLHLRAVHVNHNISAHAAEWVHLCRQRCAELGVPCKVVEVNVERGAGEGLEAAARQARRAVLRLQRADALLLAHHLDDQAETVLLQLLRGSGVAGLCAMPVLRGDSVPGAPWVRPLLDVPRARILDYAQRRELRWVEDDSNADTDLDRNYLRIEVLPRIAARFAGYRETLARAARNLGEANALLEELARQDAVGVNAGQVGASAPEAASAMAAEAAATAESTAADDIDALALPALRTLGEARARNVLRWFIARHGARAPSRERLEDGLRQLLDAGRDRQPCIALEGGELRRYDDRIEFVPTLPAVPPDWTLPWHGEPLLELPYALGRLRFDRVRGAGLRRSSLREDVVLALRRGGERLQLAPARPRRALKDMLREARLPPWQRERLPLLFVGEALAWAPGLGCDCRFAAAGDEDGVLPSWQPEVGEGTD